MQYDIKFVSYVFTGFSLSQVLGLTYFGFGLWQSSLVFLILCFVVLAPAFLDWSGKQHRQISPLSRQQILSSFMPSFVGIGVLVVGFVIGIIAGV